MAPDCGYEDYGGPGRNQNAIGIPGFTAVEKTWAVIKGRKTTMQPWGETPALRHSLPTIVPGAGVRLFPMGGSRFSPAFRQPMHGGTAFRNPIGMTVGTALGRQERGWVRGDRSEVGSGASVSDGQFIPILGKSEASADDLGSQTRCGQCRQVRQGGHPGVQRFLGYAWPGFPDGDPFNSVLYPPSLLPHQDEFQSECDNDLVNPKGIGVVRVAEAEGNAVQGQR